MDTIHKGTQMIQANRYDTSGEWFKGNVHLHTTSL